MKGAGRWIGGITSGIGKSLGFGAPATGGGGFNAMSRGAASLNQTEVAIKVTSDEGSTATIEKVRNKKGNAKVKVASEGYLGRHVLAGAGG